VRKWPLSKAGTGLWQISGTSSYSGLTSVTGGTLDITGSLTKTSSVAINAATSSANLVLDSATALPSTESITGTGSASFAPAVYVNAGSTLASIVSTGTTTFNSGTSTVGTIGGTGVVAVASGATLNVTTSLNSGPVSSGGAINVNAGASNTVGAVSGSGTLSLANASNLTAASIGQGGLVIGPGSTVTIAHDNQSATGGTPIGTSRVTTLALNAAGTLDLTNNGIAVTDTTEFGSIQSAIVASYDNAHWDLPGITSSIAASHSNDHAIGYAQASAIGSTSFNGISFADAVIARYTLIGDTNLKGSVDLGDYTKVVVNFGKTGAVWSDGNFDYSGTVGLGDYTKVVLDFGRSDSTALNNTAGPSAQQVRASSAALTLHAVPAVTTTTATDVQLLVNPSSGAVTLISAVNGSQAVITAYAITSQSGSLKRFGTSGSGKYLGASFENNPNVFYSSSNGNTYSNWTGIKNATTVIAEGFSTSYTSSSDTTWTNYTIGAGGYSLGNAFKTLASGGIKDIAFQWDDQNLNIYTSIVTYTSAPEPGSVSLIAIGAMTLLRRRRRHGRS